LRFALTNSPASLTADSTYVIGFAAFADTQNEGELFVPSANHPGTSDVQAGNLVPGGWQYLVNAGGSTIYSGQLAVRLLVTQPIEVPPLDIRLREGLIEVSWLAGARDFILEYTLQLTRGGAWLPVETQPVESNGRISVLLPFPYAEQWFRLR
jgi:hypothetical protein